MAWSGEIAPASLAAVRQGTRGEMITITEDVQNVAADLKRIDPRLHLRWSEKGGYFCVYAREDHMREGEGWLVGTYEELDQRIVRDIEKTYAKFRDPRYSFADELEAKEDEAKARREYEFSQEIGENAERLAWAIRKDLGDGDKKHAFIGEGVPGE